MGIVTVEAQIGTDRQLLEIVEFVVDTGSFYTAVTPAVRDQLGLGPGMPGQTQLAGGRIIDTEVTLARLRIQDREAVIPVEVSDVPYALLGASAPEALGLAVNPVEGTLEQKLPFPGTIRLTRFPAG